MNPGEYVFSMVDNVLGLFIRSLQTAGDVLLPHMDRLAIILLTLEITVWGIQMAVGRETDLGNLVYKFLILGVGYWVVRNFRTLAILFVDSLRRLGLMVGTSTGAAVADLTRPSNIYRFAYYQILDPIQRVLEGRGWFGSTDIGSALLILVVQIVVLLCFTFIVLQYILAMVEFHIVLVMGMMLVPFTLFKPLQFIGGKVFSAIVGQSIKIAVVMIITGVSLYVFRQVVVVPRDFNFTFIFELLGVSIIIAFIVMQAPGIASAIISGNPSLGAASLAQNLNSMVQTTMAGVSVMRGAAGSVGKMASPLGLQQPDSGKNGAGSNSSQASARSSQNDSTNRGSGSNSSGFNSGSNSSGNNIGGNKSDPGAASAGSSISRNAGYDSAGGAANRGSTGGI